MKTNKSNNIGAGIVYIILGGGLLFLTLVAFGDGRFHLRFSTLTVESDSIAFYIKFGLGIIFSLIMLASGLYYLFANPKTNEDG